MGQLIQPNLSILSLQSVLCQTVHRGLVDEEYVLRNLMLIVRQSLGGTFCYNLSYFVHRPQLLSPTLCPQNIGQVIKKLSVSSSCSHFQTANAETYCGQKQLPFHAKHSRESVADYSHRMGGFGRHIGHENTHS